MNKHLRNLLLGMSFMLSSPVYSEILSLELDSGYDSNPFQFSEQHPIESTSFTEARVKYRQRFEPGFFLIGNLKSSFYSAEAEDANETRFNFGGGIKNKYKIFSAKSSYKLELRYYMQDKTYVSKITGAIATFSGQSIADRYDSNWANIKGSTKINFNRTFALEVKGEYRDKNYESFESLGLSNLDYVQNFAVGEFTYTTDKDNRFQISAEVGLREYDNRIAKLLDGTEIVGSNLEYDYQKFSFDFRNKQGKTTWSFGFNAELREDNGGGFYDTIKNKAYMKIKYKKKSGSFISAKLSYLDQSFDNSTPLGQVVLDEEIRSKEGFSLVVDYDRNLVDFGAKEFFLHIKLSYDDFDNADPFYVYDQSMFQIGLKWRPY